MNAILGFFGKYGFLSGFCRCTLKIEWKGEIFDFTCIDEAYNARRTFDIDVQKTFQSIGPREATRKARDMKRRPGWRSARVEIMTNLVREKFRQNEGLAILLLNTGDAHLENTNRWGDKFWGVCDGEGQNNLGKILMEVRDEMK